MPSELNMVELKYLKQEIDYDSFKYYYYYYLIQNETNKQLLTSIIAFASNICSDC